MVIPGLHLRASWNMDAPKRKLEVDGVFWSILDDADIQLHDQVAYEKKKSDRF